MPGNDISDKQCLGAVEFPVAEDDAHPNAPNCLRYITVNPGGRGAAREVCDLVAAVKEKELG